MENQIQFSLGASENERMEMRHGNNIEITETKDEDESFEKHRYQRFNEREADSSTNRNTRFTELGEKARQKAVKSDGKQKAKIRLKFSPDMYTATYFSLTMEYKWRYHLSDQDVSNFVKESLLIVFL